MPARSGVSTGARIVNLDDLRSALRELDDRFGGTPLRGRALTDTYKRVAKALQAKARQRARAEGGMQAKAAMAITGAWDPLAARLQVKPTDRSAMGNVAFWGAKPLTKHGWYAWPEADGTARDGRPQFPKWVGNTWDAGRDDQGPYVLNPTIADEIDAVMAEFEEWIDELVRDTAWRWQGGGWSTF